MHLSVLTDKQRHRVTAWDAVAADIADNIEVGDTVIIEGEIIYSSYERGGVTIPTSDIKVEWIELVEKWSESTP